MDSTERADEVAARHDPDGSVSLITTDPGIGGFEFVDRPLPPMSSGKFCGITRTIDRALHNPASMGTRR